MYRYYFFLFFLNIGCLDRGVKEHQEPLFEIVDANKSGIDFYNRLSENDSVNYFNYVYIYMGGGVALGDFNNDSLLDIYYTGNMVSNRLYLNDGDLKFKDVTTISGTGGDDRWMTGVTTVDINSDGWLDIYVSVSGIWTDKDNLLFVNQGLDENEVPWFKELAHSYGIADSGNSMQTVFFDYDNDGDLDLYVANYSPTPFRTDVHEYVNKIDLSRLEDSDRLYENVGETFKDVTKSAGLLNFGLSNSIAISDFNKDGWADIYVSNDFLTPDFLYINNRNGTFINDLARSMNHTSLYGMGVDVADINNDGLPDLVQTDMTPEENEKAKSNMQSMNVNRFDRMVEAGFHYQYMQNSLQLNRGTTNDGITHFSEISQYAGLSYTDWSWGPLIADLNNDGLKDIYICNGSRRDINNRDYFIQLNKDHKSSQLSKSDYLKIINAMPSEKVENYVFANRGNLKFADSSKRWGLNYKGFTTSSAYGDLDNDGDLDIVVNNVDSESFIYRNRVNEREGNSYLRLMLDGPDSNLMGFGSKVTIKYDGQLQYVEMTPTRGFQSSVEQVIHFGMSSIRKVDTLSIIWPDGAQQQIFDVETNQVLRLDYKHALERNIYSNDSMNQSGRLFEDITTELGLDHKHKENQFDDYFYQILLPHKMSHFGPALAVGDANNDGLDDFFIGGAVGYPGSLFIQNQAGEFTVDQTDQPWKADKLSEDVGAVFFDANGDSYDDLYVVSGGNEYPANSINYQDRLYVNMGNGDFEKVILPDIRSSGSRVRTFDFDKDNDLDLFVGGRQVPRNYPKSANSYLLLNETNGFNINFSDVTESVAPDLIGLGMVSDAAWVDINEDENVDLVIVGEWMPITILLNENDRFVNRTEELGFSETKGWWNSIVSADFDADGDKDLIVGNLGLNYKYKASAIETFDIYASDFDKNKSLDIVLGYYQNGAQYPVRGKECASEQIPAIKYKYKNYASYAEANLREIYTPNALENSLHYLATDFASYYLENLGQGKLEFTRLPYEAQLSSINDVVIADVNSDMALDIIAFGNLYHSEIETPRNDASYGTFLAGNGKGQFELKPPNSTGLHVSGDVRNTSLIYLKDGVLGVIVAKNDDQIQIIRVNKNRF